MTRSEPYEKYSDDLVRSATGLVGPTDAPDVVSTAPVHVLRSRSWDAVENQRAYLYRSVLNDARRHHKTAMRRRAAEMRGASPGSIGPSIDVRPDVLDAVGQMSVHQRAVVFLSNWEDLRPVDIARRFGLSKGTVHRNLSRAEARLKRMLHEWQPGPGDPSGDR